MHHHYQGWPCHTHSSPSAFMGIRIFQGRRKWVFKHQDCSFKAHIMGLSIGSALGGIPRPTQLLGPLKLRNCSYNIEFGQGALLLWVVRMGLSGKLGRRHLHFQPCQLPITYFLTG